jgi:hypothetical protein
MGKFGLKLPEIQRLPAGTTEADRAWRMAFEILPEVRGFCANRLLAAFWDSFVPKI